VGPSLAGRAARCQRHSERLGCIGMTLATALLALSLASAPSPQAPVTLVGAGALGPGGAA